MCCIVVSVYYIDINIDKIYRYNNIVILSLKSYNRYIRRNLEILDILVCLPKIAYYVTRSICIAVLAD